MRDDAVPGRTDDVRWLRAVPDAEGPEPGDVSDPARTGTSPTPSPDQLDWDALASAPDQRAFRRLFDRHRKVVYNHCFRSLGDWSAAEDATQAVFLALWRRALSGDVDRLRGDTARPIVLQMARHECLSQLRAGARRSALLDRAEQVATTGNPPGDPADRWVDAEVTMAAIHEALSQLSQGQRDVIALVCWDELSMAEAAETLGVSEGTVKSRLFRARDTLSRTDAAALLGGVR